MTNQNQSGARVGNGTLDEIPPPNSSLVTRHSSFVTLKEGFNWGVGEVSGPGDGFTGNMPLIGIDSEFQRGIPEYCLSQTVPGKFAGIKQRDIGKRKRGSPGNRPRHVGDAVVNDTVH